MKQARKLLRKVSQRGLISLGLAVGLFALTLYRLGSITNGFISGTEATTNSLKLGWHGLYDNPLYLPLNLLRSIDFFLFHNHTVFLLRLPNAIFGMLTIACFTWLIYLWHGKRVTYLAGIMFACSAWTLHVSRLASYDILYLWAMVSALLGYVCLNEFDKSKLAWYLNALLIGLFATIPGLIWLSLIMLFFEKEAFKEELSESSLVKRLISILLLIIWLPLVIYRSHVNHALMQWLGLPQHFGSITHVLKEFAAVPFHLLVRGPLYPQLWLDKSPVLDIFAIAMLLLGVYTYGQHKKNTRSRLLASLGLLSIILIGLNGSVSFSLIIPIAYLFIAMGLSYLIHSWKKVFPLNPVAKWVSITIVVLAVTLSCLYNLRSYFVAWPHNPNTYTTFDQTV